MNNISQISNSPHLKDISSSKSFQTSSDSYSYYTNQSNRINPNILVNEHFIMNDASAKLESEYNEPNCNPFISEMDIFDKNITFEPKFFNFPLAEKRYKEYESELTSISLLPKILLSKTITKKLIKAVEKNDNKNILLLINKEHNQDNNQEKLFILDDLTYSCEDFNQENYYNYIKYPIILAYKSINQTSSSIDNTNISSLTPYLNINFDDDFKNDIDLINTNFYSVQNGLSSYVSYDCCYNNSNNSNNSNNNINYNVNNDQISTQNDINSYIELRNNQIIYLNMFRLYAFIIKHHDSYGNINYKFHKIIYFPNIIFHIKSLYRPFKLVSSPLTNLLTKKGGSSAKKKKSSFKFGFITLDQNQRMLLIMASDPLVSQVPLIGLWAHGISPKVEAIYQNEEDNQVLLGILFEYITNPHLKNKYSFDSKRKTFLLALFSYEESTQYYEIQLREDRLDDKHNNKWLMLRNTEEFHDAKDFKKHTKWIFQYKTNLCLNGFQSLKHILMMNSIVQPIRQSQKSKNNKKHIKQKTKNPSMILNDITNRDKKQQQRIMNNSTIDNHNINKYEFFNESDNEEINMDTKIPKPQPQPYLKIEDSQRTPNFWNKEEGIITKPSHTYQNIPINTFHGNPSQFSFSGSGFGALLTRKDINKNEQLSDKENKLGNEKLYLEQAEEIKFLKEQLLALQNFILNSNINPIDNQRTPSNNNTNNHYGNILTMNNTSLYPGIMTSEQNYHMENQGLSKLSTINQNGNIIYPFPITENKESHGRKPITEKMQNLINKIEVVSRSTNTTFSLNNQDTSAAFSENIYGKKDTFKLNLPNPSSKAKFKEIETQVTESNISIPYISGGPIDKHYKGIFENDVSFEKLDMSISKIQAHDQDTNNKITEESLDNQFIKGNQSLDLLKDNDISIIPNPGLPSLPPKENGALTSRDHSTENILQSVYDMQLNKNMNKKTEENHNHTLKIPNLSSMIDNSQISTTSKYMNEGKVLPTFKMIQNNDKKTQLDTENKENNPYQANTCILTRVNLSQQVKIEEKDNKKEQFKSVMLPILNPNNGTADSISLEREILKLKIPEDVNLDPKIIIPNKKNSVKNEMILQPIDPSNDSIKIPKIKFDLKRFNIDSDDEDISEVDMKYLKQLKKI